VTKKPTATESTTIPVKSSKCLTRLILVVEYEEGASVADAQELVEKAREAGWPRFARLERFGPMVEDLV
jgi:hypothetical protein